MKTTNTKNEIWFKEEGNIVLVGFTSSFLDQLDGCWQILPATRRMFKKNAPLLTVETNDGLYSVSAPFSGTLMDISQQAQNFPDQLTEDSVVMTINTRATGMPAIAEAPAAERRVLNVAELVGVYQRLPNETQAQYATRIRNYQAMQARGEALPPVAHRAPQAVPARPFGNNPVAQPMPWDMLQARVENEGGPF